MVIVMRLFQCHAEISGRQHGEDERLEEGDKELKEADDDGETAREEREKQQALWRVALEFGLVFALEDFLSALRRIG